MWKTPDKMRWRMKEKNDGMGVVKEMMEKYSGRVKGAGKGRGKKVTVTAIGKERGKRDRKWNTFTCWQKLLLLKATGSGRQGGGHIGRLPPLVLLPIIPAADTILHNHQSLMCWSKEAKRTCQCLFFFFFALYFTPFPIE